MPIWDFSLPLHPIGEKRVCPAMRALHYRGCRRKEHSVNLERYRIRLSISMIVIPERRSRRIRDLNKRRYLQRSRITPLAFPG
jgi:hypothetical protein